MKKLLLTALCAACMATASAASYSYTYTCDRLGGENVNPLPETLTWDGFTLTPAKAEGTNAPAYYASSADIRLYANNTLTVAAPAGVNITSISFALTSGWNQKGALSCTSGEMTQGTDVNPYIWNDASGANAVTFTVSDLAEYGKDATKKGQLRFVSLTITTDAQVATDTPDQPQEPELPEGVIYTIDFTKTKGEWTTDDGASQLPAYVWSRSEKYGMVANGYLNNVAYNCDAYLKSPVIDLTAAVKPVMNFDQAINKFGITPAEAYDQGYIAVYLVVEGSPNMNDLDFAVPEQESWNFVSSGDVDLSKYVGKKVHFEFEYVSDEDVAGIWEIKNFTVKESEDQPVVETQGEGTEEKPYTVKDVQLLDNPADEPKAWVNGYIVGTLHNNLAGAEFGVEDPVNTNLLLGAAADTRTTDDCVPVALPSGSVREALNLLDNPGNFEKEVTLYGTLTKYFGVAGVKNVTKYVFQNTTSVQNVADESTPVIYYNLQGVRVANPESGVYVRIQNGQAVKVAM